jgi:hypothetical protein
VLRAEAVWLARRLERIPTEELSPLLSIGSGASALRATQPWLERSVYAPLTRRGVQVLHHELEPAPGVDVAGDLTDPGFLERLGELELRSVMCCNVLEHVPNPAGIAAGIERLVPAGGYLFVSVPRRYPYHPGPIDSLLRPSVEELRSLFPNLTLEDGAEIRCESLLAYFLASPTKWTSLTRGVRTKAPSHARIPVTETLRMLLLSTAVSAVVLRAEP